MIEHRSLGPSTFVSGVSALERLEPALTSATSVLVVTTTSVATNPRVFDRVRAALRTKPTRVVSDIRAHVPVEALDALVATPFDAVVSVGGGSPIDAAKLAVVMAQKRITSASVGTFRPQDPFEPLLHVAVPTTLSGAELSPTAGFTQAHRKTGIFHSKLSPQWVLADATAAMETPVSLWLSTGIRAIDHAVEGLLAQGEHPLSDAAAREGLPRLLQALEKTARDGVDVEARHQAAVAAFLCYQLPLESQTGPSHTLGKRLGASFGIPHGMTSCLVLPAVLDVLPRDEKWKALQALLGGAPGEVLRAFVAKLGLQRRLTDFGVGAQERAAVASETVHPSLSREQVEAVLASIA
jgi:alcohol dehydrogenase class IV